MFARSLMAVVTVAFLGHASSRAQEALVTYKTLSLEIALDLANAALADCRQRGFQVAVAVVDRFGITQVVLRDRFAPVRTHLRRQRGRLEPRISFGTNTTDLVPLTQPGMPQAAVRNLPGAVVLGGGIMVQTAGSLVGAVGVSGAPGGDADDACAKAGISAIQNKIDF